MTEAQITSLLDSVYRSAVERANMSTMLENDTESWRKDAVDQLATATNMVQAAEKTMEDKLTGIQAREDEMLETLKNLAAAAESGAAGLNESKLMQTLDLSAQV